MKYALTLSLSLFLAGPASAESWRAASAPNDASGVDELPIHRKAEVDRLEVSIQVAAAHVESARAAITHAREWRSALQRWEKTLIDQRGALAEVVEAARVDKDRKRDHDLERLATEDSQVEQHIEYTTRLQAAAELRLEHAHARLALRKGELALRKLELKEAKERAHVEHVERNDKTIARLAAAERKTLDFKTKLQPVIEAEAVAAEAWDSAAQHALAVRPDGSPLPRWVPLASR